MKRDGRTKRWLLHRERGSITVFVALLLTAIFSALFAYLEAARVSALRANSEESTMQARDTVLASYHRGLWEQYHLLFWEMPDGDPDALGTLQKEAIEANRAETILNTDNYYVLPVHLTEVKTSVYQLVTDYEGAAFRSQAEEMMKHTLAENVVDDLLAWFAGEDSEEETDLEKEALDALDTLESAAAEAANGGGETESGTETEATDTSGDVAVPEVEIKENPLEWVRQIAKDGVLSLVVPEETISEKAIETASCLSNRTLSSGNNPVVETGGGLTENAWFALYLDEYFSDFTESTGDHALDYELEYLIAGKASDRENAKAVVRQLILMREGANMLFLETNTEKREMAAAVATVISTVALVPELETLVEQGILAAWAYAESISDVRILLEGGKVRLVKTEDQWHTNITSLSSSVLSADGKQQSEGLSYADYLQVLMLKVSNETLTERAMDLIEKNLNVQMDHMLCYAECDYVYESSPLFWNFVTLGNSSLGVYRFKDHTTISFLNLTG